MEENTFWAVIWAIAATVLITITMSITIYNTDVNTNIVSAIKSGADPIKATCALDFNQYKQGICTVAAK